MWHALVEVIKLHTAVIKLLMIARLDQLLISLLDSKNLNFWHLSSGGWWMTGNSDLISGQNCIYVTHSGRGNQTAHSGDKIVKIPRLDQLLISLFDSKNLNFWHFSSGGWWLTGNSDLISGQNCIYVTLSGRGSQTAQSCDKIIYIPRLDQLLISLLDSKNLNFDTFQAGDAEWLAIAT